MKHASIRTLWGAAICCTTLICTTANAQDPTNWGTYALAYTLNCISPDCSGGGVSGGASAFGPEVDEIEASPATSSIVNPLGNSTVTAGFETLTPGLNTINITGTASSIPGGTGLTVGKALAFYRYNGPPVTITVTTTISGTHSGPLSGADSNIDGINATTWVFTDPDSISDIDAFDQGAFLSCLFECYSPDAEMNVELDQDVSILSDSVDLMLVDGDGFYVNTTASISAAGGGSAATVDGIKVTFSSTAGLTSILPAGGGGPDADGDGVTDDVDNCTLVANADQRDSNGDGFGNVCDFDYTNNCVVNFLDLAPFSAAFGSSTGDPNFDDDIDLDGNGVINFLDFGAPPNNFAAAFTNPPGPSTGACTPM